MNDSSRREIYLKHKAFLLTRIGELHEKVREAQERLQQYEGALKENTYHLQLAEECLRVLCNDKEEVEGDVIEAENEVVLES